MPRPLKPFGSVSSGKMAARGNAKRWGQMPTRLQMHAKNNLGVIMQDQGPRGKVVRNDKLDLYDSYLDSTQYDDLRPWDECSRAEEYVPIRSRKPRVIYNLAQVLVNKVTSKLMGESVFPKFTVEDDPEDTEFFRTVMKACSFRRNLLEPIRKCLGSGSSFVRYFLVDGSVIMEWANAKYCYPKFDAKGELSEIEIKYVYEDVNDQDEKGEYRLKWYRLLMNTDSDVLFDNPEYKENVEPKFVEVERNDHALGWVQGEWLRTTKHKFDPDGDSLFGKVLDFIDDLNYSLSQSSQAVQYNQDPQLIVNGIDEEDLSMLIKSSTKAWNLGKEGKAEFVESSLKGIETAQATRDDMRTRMLEVVRCVLHDPEKIVGSAQSGAALKLLHGPLVELVDELRTILEPLLVNLLTKIALTLLEMNARGEETILQAPAGYQPASLDLTVDWPEIFPLTLSDLLQKSQVANTLSMARIISKESLTRWMAPDIGIENIDEELQKISVQPVDNPFGSFGG